MKSPKVPTQSRASPKILHRKNQICNPSQDPPILINTGPAACTEIETTVAVSRNVRKLSAWHNHAWGSKWIVGGLEVDRRGSGIM